jgi:hypothetical protein
MMAQAWPGTGERRCFHDVAVPEWHTRRRAGHVVPDACRDTGILDRVAQLGGLDRHRVPLGLRGGRRGRANQYTHVLADRQPVAS